jgi:hypothetical protein
MNRKLKVKQAFQTVFHTSGLINRAYFFITVPFFISLLFYAANGENVPAILAATLMGIGLILDVLFSLYLMATAFFYSQQIAEHDWSDYVLILSEVVSDLGVKLKLVLIRAFWYGLLLIVLLVLVELISLITGKSIIAEFYAALLALSFVDTLANPANLALNIASLGLLVGGITGVWIIIQAFELSFINVSLYLYALTGSLKSSFNPVRIVKLLWKHIVDYSLVIAISFAGKILLALLTVLAIPFLIIPFLGGLVGGFISGLDIMYQYLFIPNLQGQIWSKMNLNKELGNKDES